MPVIPATQEAEIRRITVPSQSRQIVHETLPQKKKKAPVPQQHKNDEKPEIQLPAIPDH
jgi:hypothetical protein